jgi:hypothetical protein
MSDVIRGGGHVGPSLWFGYRATWPIASLTVAPNSIVFSMWPIEYAFDKSSIICLQKKKILGCRVLSIVHTNPDFAKSVVFRPINFVSLESLLERHGFRASSEEPNSVHTKSIKYSRRVSNVAYVAAIAGFVAGVLACLIVAAQLSG